MLVSYGSSGGGDSVVIFVIGGRVNNDISGKKQC